MKPHVDWFALSPVLAMLAATGVALLSAVLVPRWARRQFAAIVTAIGFAGGLTAAALVYAWSGHGEAIIAHAIDRDRYGAFAEMIVAGCGLIAVGISYERRGRAEHHDAEFFALLAAAGAGMAFLVTANNLMTLFLSLEWLSVSLYILCAIDIDLEGSLEAGLKYLIIGSFGSAALLFGSALVYGATGELGFRAIAAAVDAQSLQSDPLLLTGLAMMIAGLGYKASAAPFHQWTPDVYEGAPTPITAFMSAATKTVAVVVALRVLVSAFPAQAHLWTIAAAVIACASLAIGNLAALVQRNVKRLLAYSSISHAGFMFIAIASNNAAGGEALLYYLIPYSAMSLGAFAVVAARERELGKAVTLDDMAGMGWERPLLGFAMWTFMLGFIGFPLTGGFWGKFLVFRAAYDHGWVWLMIVGVVATLVSVPYYLAVLRAMYLRSGAELRLAQTTTPVAAGGSPPREGWLTTAVIGALGVTIASFFAVQPLIDGARDAANALPF